jgi:tripartite-type tricarboxylate transporter receptor subunit TctC
MVGRRNRSWAFAILAFFALDAVGTRAAFAEQVEPFTRQQVRVVTGFAPGATNDLYGRLVARHIGRHLPGNPTVIPVNMPGAGSLRAANYIYNVAPKDGTVFGLMASTLINEELLGNPGAQFKSDRYNWIGRVSSFVLVSFTWHTARVKTVNDALMTEVTLGGTAVGSGITLQPMILNGVLGTKFKIVNGYKGAGDATLAMERGEVDGATNGWTALTTLRPELLKERKLNMLVQYGLHRRSDLADVPTSVELGKTESDRRVLALYAIGSEIGKFFVAPPDVPADRLVILRAAFDAMLKDPVFIADVTKQSLDYDPMSGDALQRMVTETVRSTSPDVVARAKAILGY